MKSIIAMGPAAFFLRCALSMRFTLLLFTFACQFESPLALDPTCEPGHLQFPMTNLQTQLCDQYPELVSILMTDVIKVFQHHCYQQFKYERWDCSSNIIPPIFGTTQPFLSLQNKEVAFVHALASAAVVHTVTQKCVENASTLHYCGCDRTLKNEVLPAGQKWAGCSPDIHFSIGFAKKFVDRRVDNATLQQKTFVIHNNKIGRSTVMEYMYKNCTCVDPRRCHNSKVCQLVLPTMDEVALKLKLKYDQSVHSIIIPSSSYLYVLVVDRKNRHKVHPREMIYFNYSPGYCKANPEYNITGIAGRECTLYDTSLSQHCKNLCCNHGYKISIYKLEKPCQCKFIWCCRTECKVCYEIKTKNRCRDKLPIS